MAGTAADAAASVWVTHGEQGVHRCPAGEALSSPQGFLLAHPPGTTLGCQRSGVRLYVVVDFSL